MKVAHIAALVLLAALVGATSFATGAAYADDAPVLVGSVDSGVEFSHPAFAGTALWTNAAEAGGRPGVDDDGDGCVDDVHGCDFVNGDGDPSDDNGHGTATAGEVVAEGGTAPAARLIVAKVLDAHGAGTTSKLAAGLAYVADAGAKVVIVSVGGVRSTAVHAAIASHPGTLFVVAAGNAGADVDGGAAPGSYPCSDPSGNVVCVGASTQADTLTSLSNFGASSVDLVAPGERVTAPTLTGWSSGWTGTSFAAPPVAGVAALAFAQQPGASVAQVKAAILGSVDRFDALSGKVATGGRLNAYRALRALRGNDPGQTLVSPDAPAAPAAVASAPAASPAAAPVAAVAHTPAAAQRKAVKKKAAKKTKKKTKKKARAAAKRTTAKRMKARSTKRTKRGVSNKTILHGAGR